MNKKNIINYNNKVRIRSEKELKTRRIEFLKICTILNKLNIRYFLQTGILLGAIRENGFIPWDWDVEISVYSEEVFEKINQIVFEINRSGFKVEKCNKKLSDLKIDFIGKLPKETTHYTIFGWNYNINKKIFWRNKFKVPEHLFLKMKKIKLFGRYHFAPYPPEDYLEYQYGDWKRPLRSHEKKKYLTREYYDNSPIKNLIMNTINAIHIK